MNPVFLFMAIASFLCAMASPYFLLNLAFVWCAWEYYKMAAD